MSTSTKWASEREATRSFLDLQEQAERCRDMYVRAHMRLPEPLRRFLDIDATDGAGSQPSLSGMAPPQFPKPSIATDEWVWVEFARTLPMTAIPAVLRDESQPLRARDVVTKVVQLLPKASAGSVANLFSKLDGKVIRREQDGWVLINREKAPIVYDGRLWGTSDVFQQTEIAAYRRDIIVHVLRQFDSGLQIVQIVDQLQRLEWLQAPFNKDLVKADMQALQVDGRVRHRGNSRKWEATPEKPN